MRTILFRASMLLSCVIAINCGGAELTNPTSPSSSTSPASPSSPTSPTTPGGAGPTGNTAILADNTFNDNDWDQEVELLGTGGSGSAGHVSFNGQAGADYRRITITVNNASNAAAAQVAVFSIRRGQTYFPTSDGAIFSIDYSEDSILFSGGANGQYSAPAVKQNGKLYTLVPGAGAFPTPDGTWTAHSLTGLTQNDFRTIASASEHPDFSAAGARMDLGFMRLHSVAAGGVGETRVGGIDNLRMILRR